MKKELFIEHVKRKGIMILGDKPKIHFDTNVKDFRAVKSLFEYIDFDCQHNKDGGCRKYGNEKMCCCYNCFESGGYFRVLIGNDITYYSRKFNAKEKNGFWRKEKGCILPHKMRSAMCLTHCCIDESHSPEFGHGMELLQTYLTKLRRRI